MCFHRLCKYQISEWSILGIPVVEDQSRIPYLYNTILRPPIQDLGFIALIIRSQWTEKEKQSFIIHKLSIWCGCAMKLIRTVFVPCQPPVLLDCWLDNAASVVILYVCTREDTSAMIASLITIYNCRLQPYAKTARLNGHLTGDGLRFSTPQKTT